MRRQYNIMLRILSVDPAVKSLAVSISTFNTEILKDIGALHAEYKKRKASITALPPDSNTANALLQNMCLFLDQVNGALDDRHVVEYLAVTDLIDGKKVNQTEVVERAFALCTYLKKVDKKIAKLERQKAMPLQILIEYQMGPNDLCRGVASQILYHFMNKYCSSGHTQLAQIPVTIIGPSLKNVLYLHGDEGSHLGAFILKYRKPYDANKAHSRYNLVTILTRTDRLHFIKNIKKENLDDAGDALISSIAWVLKYTAESTPQT
jgi:hypothetical protein